SAADSSSDRLVDVFKNRKDGAYGKVIVRGDTQGTFRLAPAGAWEQERGAGGAILPVQPSSCLPPARHESRLSQGGGDCCIETDTPDAPHPLDMKAAGRGADNTRAGLNTPHLTER